jgi:hypothetical protein
LDHEAGGVEGLAVGIDHGKVVGEAAAVAL